MAKQFKRYSVHVVSQGAQLVKQDHTYTYPADLSEAKVKLDVSRKLGTHPDNIFLGTTVVVELR